MNKPLGPVWEILIGITAVAIGITMLARRPVRRERLGKRVGTPLTKYPRVRKWGEFNTLILGPLGAIIIGVVVLVVGLARALQ